MISMSIRQVALAAAICAALPVAAQAQSITLERVGYVGATGMSDDGRAVVGYMNANNHLIRWTPETGVVQLGRNTNGQTKGGSGDPAISRDGTVIASTILDDTGKYRTQGRWTTTGGWQQIGPLPADAAIVDREDSTVFGMSGDGTAVTGFYWSANYRAHASVWRAATGTVGLPADPTVSSRVDAANLDGSVVVGWSEGVTGARQATVWANGVRTLLEGSEISGEAAAVNAAGTIIVGQGTDPARQRSVAAIWKWNGSTWDKQTLGVLPGTTETGYSYATGVSDDGSVVVGFNRAKFNFFETTGFIWTAETGMQSVDHWLHSRGKDIKQKLDVRFVPAINGAGTAMVVIGQGKNPPYTRRSVIVRVNDAFDKLGAR